jgi:hypothetical protein
MAPTKPVVLAFYARLEKYLDGFTDFVRNVQTWGADIVISTDSDLLDQLLIGSQFRMTIHFDPLKVKPVDCYFIGQAVENLVDGSILGKVEGGNVAVAEVGEGKFYVNLLWRNPDV